MYDSFLDFYVKERHGELLREAENYRLLRSLKKVVEPDQRHPHKLRIHVDVFHLLHHRRKLEKRGPSSDNHPRVA